jgi:hypothetical protein
VVATVSGTAPPKSRLRRWSGPWRQPVARWIAGNQPGQAAVTSLDSRPFVRARPEYVLVEERLAYEQEISRNPSTHLQHPPSGRIRINVPYDGGDCFGPDARDDAERALDGNGWTRQAVIGHLVFVEHEETDLDNVLGLDGTYGPYPLRVPIRSKQLHDPETLTSDRFAYRNDISYRPPADGPKVIPLKVDVDIFDPGYGDGTFLETSVIESVRDEPELQRAVAEMIKDSAEFEPYLTARVQVHLSLPPRKPADGPESKPVVRSVRITLPEGTTLPLSTVRLHDVLMEDEPDEDHFVQTDARAGSFEWSGREMRVGAKSDDAPRVYDAVPVDVRFLQPGELFRQREIQVDVEVELPDELTSGAQVRYFDATGTAPRKGGATPLKVRTILSSRCRVLLYDAFTKRRISPSQSFCFDEIVPDKERIADVKAALVDQRFDIQLDKELKGHGKKQIEHLLIATRRDGPRTMQLWIYIDGRRHPTQRESRHPWGQRFRSKFESGTLNVHVRGLVHGDARGVTREINALHLGLYERFQRMKALR